MAHIEQTNHQHDNSTRNRRLLLLLLLLLLIAAVIILGPRLFTRPPERTEAPTPTSAPVVPATTRISPPPEAAPSAKLPTRGRPATPKTVEIPLPAPADDARADAAGRFLFVSMQPRKEVAVFEARRRGVVRTLAAPSNDFTVTADAEYVTLVDRKSGNGQRWDLESFRPEPIPPGTATTNEPQKSPPGKWAAELAAKKVLLLPAPRAPWMIALKPSTEGRLTPWLYYGTSQEVAPMAEAAALTVSTPDGPGLTIDQRIHWFMDDNLIVTIPEGAPRLVQTGLNIDDAMAATRGGKVLALDSTPTTPAVRGRMWTTPLYASSNHQVVECWLEAAPPGMTIGPSGILRWPVPADAPDRVEVRLRIKGSEGQEVKNAFVIQVR